MAAELQSTPLRNCLKKVIDYRGKTPKKLGSDWTNEGYRALSAINVKDSGLTSLDSIRYLDEETYKKWMREEVQRGDILLTSEAPAGEVMIWDSEEKIVLSQRLFCLRTNKQFDNRFIKYYLQSPTGKREVNRTRSGSTVTGISAEMFDQIQVVHPSLTEQRRIATVLSAIDAKIDLNNRINAGLEALAKTVYDYWFVQFDFPDAKGRPYKTSGGKMVWNETLKREIPAGWRAGVLWDIANITMGQSPAGESYNVEGNGVVFFQGSTDFGIRSPDVRMFTTSPGRMAREGDILVSVRAPVGTLNVADRDCCIGRGLAALNSKDGCDGYLYQVMVDFKQIFDRRSAEGTTFGSITKDDLFGLKVLIPDERGLDTYSRMENDWMRLAAVRDRENRELTQLRNWLLPLLMNGQVKPADL